MTVAFEWNEPNFDHVFHSWEGPVGAFLKERTHRVQALAIARAGHRTGALKSQINTYFGHVGKALEARVGANAGPGDGKRGYGYWHHEGTLPHMIHAKAGGVLRWHVAGSPVYATSVHHPGFRGNPYLTSSLREVF